VQTLKDKIAVVAGATRGAGRGIACMLGEAGATVYCTGRSVKGSLSPINRPETIEETARMVTNHGGVGIWVQVDYTQPDQVKNLFERVKNEQDGRLDILVNDISGDSFLEWDKWGGKWNTPFWELTLEKGLQMQIQGVHTHIIASYFAIPLMIERCQGLVVEVTDGNSLEYRGRLFYDLAKVSAIRLAYAMSVDLRKYNIAVVALSPGYLRSEIMLEWFGVTAENWQEGIERDPGFENSETPYYVGRAVAALAADLNVMNKTGRALSSGWLARDYGFTDIDGRRPAWNRGEGEFNKEGFAIQETNE
jgi:NAD(P)-dependent dehydrogenase (short-subunit alcohol dehydrogenase family)